MLGHELRNPLAPILTAVELLATASHGRPREQASSIGTSEHLVRLVDDLLDISRVTRGHVELRARIGPAGDGPGPRVEIAAPLISRHSHSLTVGERRRT